MKRLLLIINLLEDSFFVASLFVVGFVIADILFSEKIIFFRTILAFACHQKIEKCFSVFNQPMSLCARCLGIYLGFVVFYKIINRLKRYSYLYHFSIIYLCVDLIMELGLKVLDANLIRFLFGIVFSFSIIKSIDLIRNFVIVNNFEPFKGIYWIPKNKPIE